jgi:hypothetical protein
MADAPRPETAPDELATDALSEFFANYAQGGYRFLIYRRSPKSWPVAGVPREIEGHLETIEEVPTPEYLKSTWGGGTYLVQIQAPATEGKGGYRFVTARTVKIAGDPKIRPQDFDVSTAAQPVDTSKQVFAERLIEQAALRSERAEERLERERNERLEAERERARIAALMAERKTSPEPAVWQSTIQAIQTSAESQVETLRQQLSRRDAEMAEIRREIVSRPAGDPQLVTLLLNRSKDDEIRVIENHRRELDALRREHEQTISMIERLHRAEVETLRTGYEGQMRTIATAHQTAIEAREREIERLHDELGEARAAAAPTDPLQRIQEMAELDEILERRYARKGDGPSGWIEIAKEIAASMGQRAPLQLVPPQPPAPRQQVAAPPAQAKVIPFPKQPSAPPPPPVPAETEIQDLIEPALRFVEDAMRNGTAPADAARTARSLFPKSALDLLAQNDPRIIVGEIARMFGPDRLVLSPGGREYLGRLIPALREEPGRA